MLHLANKETNQLASIILAAYGENWSFWFPTRSDTNQHAQSQKKLQIYTRGTIRMAKITLDVFLMLLEMYKHSFQI